MQSKIKSVGKVSSWIITVLIIFFAVLLVGFRIIGLTPYIILSGSMAPKYPVGSIIYVKDVEPSSIEKGDPITFVISGSNTVATHRVVDIKAQEGAFITKGDANEYADDAPVYFENLLGKPIFKIPYLGFIASFLSTPLGRFTGILIVLALVVSSLFQEFTKKRKSSENKQKEIEDREK